MHAALSCGVNREVRQHMLDPVLLTFKLKLAIDTKCPV